MLTRPFETENKQAENKNRLAGIVVTVVIHALLFLLLFYLYITPPDPPYQDNAGGMSVNYGTTDASSGDQQQYTAVPVKVATEQDMQSTPPPVAASQENLETQDKEDAAVVEKKTEVKKTKTKPNPDANYKPVTKTTTTTVTTPPKPKVDQNALFSPGALGNPNKSKGDGDKTGTGDQGNPNGDPNSKNYHGGPGTGNGPGGSGTGPGNVRLSGRSLRSRPTIKSPCENTKGKVVMEIKVNRSGHVTDAKFTQSGSTTGDECLISTARQAAMKYVFDENNGAAETQTGSITFIFKED